MTGRHIGIAISLLLLVGTASARADTVFVEANQDATLIEDPDGALANGAGPVFFVGRTNQRANSVRRGLIHFDVDAVLPKKAVIESVRLTLYMTPANPSPTPINLHRLLADWGEGTSYASGGGGDYSTPGDSTWIHTFYDDEFWVRSGGHFVARSSGVQEVSGSGYYAWESTQKMVADVRTWLAAPRRNFGWILIGDETVAQNSKSFASREDPDPSLRPILEVTYRVPGR